MTNMESLYGSGKFTEIMQSVKLTAIKKITAEEVEFYTSEERFDIHGQLRKFMKGKNILKERKSLRIGGDFPVPNSRELFWQGSSEKTADMLFNALAEFSEKTKISFLGAVPGPTPKKLHPSVYKKLIHPLQVLFHLFF